MSMKSGNTKMVSVTRERAEEIAVAILAWLSAQPDLMNRFLAISGIEASQIRQAARETGFLGGLTGFIMNHEPTLMAFCNESGIAVEEVQAAHRDLAGPHEGVWL